MDRIHEVHVVQRETSSRICGGPGKRLEEIQATTRPDYLWPEIWIGTSKAAKKKEKQGWAMEIPKLNNARKLRRINFIDPEDGEYKETIKNARKILEVPMEATMPCKIGTRKRARKSRETVASESHQLSQENQDCLYCVSPRVHEEAFGIHSSKKSCGSHRCKKGFIR